MNNITVVTPAYNRGKLLQTLYNSLQNQDCKEFEWIIVDDGSTDDTSVYVEQMKQAADFKISYYKKMNGGKHTALNYAYQFIKTPLTFIVDSDDFLTKDAITRINNVYKKYKDENGLCGFSFLRGKPNGGYLSTSGVPKDGMKESYVECRINRGIGGDMAEVWYTHCLKEYPFPEFQGEKFLGEDIVWVRMSEKYDMRFFNRVIYISDYLEDGLTNNRRKHNINSPNGCVARARVFLSSKSKIKVKVKAMLQYHIYGNFSNNKKKLLYKNIDNKILFLITYLPAQLLYLIWKKKFSKKNMI